MGVLRLATAGWLACALVTSAAQAETYRVTNDDELYGRSRGAQPGDVIEVAPGTYSQGLYLKVAGAPGKPITLRGVVEDGKRPLFTGDDKYTISAVADHWVFENLDITGKSSRCFFHGAHDITLRDVAIHDCPYHGLLSGDEGSGSLLLERCELYNNGEGDRHHQIYATTDQDAHPGSVFRLSHSYIHDGRGGNNVKSRAQRNEIYFNWIEGAFYHELELIGPDASPAKPAREDSEVVGNVLWQRNEAYAMRLGGDGTNDTNGRYRLVNNTIIVPAKHRPPLRLFDGLESVELYNNVFYAEGGGPLTLTRDKEAKWARGAPLFFGSHNFIPDGSSEVPAALAHTIGGDPKLADLASNDLRPLPGSPLIDAGTTPATNPEAPFPNPLAKLDAQPPNRRAGVTLARVVQGAVDVGAYESVASFEPDAASAPPLPSPVNAVAAEPVTPPPPPKSRCSCSTVGARDAAPWWLWLGLVGVWWRRAR